MVAVATIDFDAEFEAITSRIKLDQEKRTRPPVVKLYDGNYTLRGRATMTDMGSFQEIDSETGIGKLEMPEEYYLSKWIVDHDERQYKNVHVTVEKDGVRWSGRMDHYEVEKDRTGRTIVRVLFKHDYEEFKHILCWANPFLPAEIQFPRLWLLFGNAKWALKTTLFVNILRLEASLWMLPDGDPLDLSQWFNLDQSTWSMVVAPTLEPDNSPVAVVHSRFKTFHDVARRILADGQLTPTFRRFLNGDEPPWPGADLKHGCLVIDIEDKSGWVTETSFGGNIFTGLIRAFINIAGDGATQSVNIVNDPAFPDEYSQPGFKGTFPQAPGIVYREGEHTGIQTSLFVGTPAKDVQVVTGGHSMPGVNELISAAIQMAGDLIAAMIGVPPVGGAADAILKPLYTDCVAAGTVVHSPDGDARIEDLAEPGKPFRVWSLTPEGRRVPAMAVLAFKKCRAELFEYTLDDGRTIKATGGHRFLTRKGFVPGSSIGIGAEVATADHDALSGGRDGVQCRVVRDSEYEGVPETDAVIFRGVVDIRPIGEGDVYDMHVPGWENYSANGFWNHNTILAFMAWKSPARAQSLGDFHYNEKWAEGADRAYTLQALISLRAALWATRETFTHKLTVADGAPWIVGQRGKGHFYVGDRIGSTVKGTPKGKIYVDRVSDITLEWDRTKPPTWNITIGQREQEDPVAKAYELIQELFGIARDLGVL